MKFKFEYFGYNRRYSPLGILFTTLGDLWDFEPDGSGCKQQTFKIELMLIFFSLRFIWYKVNKYETDPE